LINYGLECFDDNYLFSYISTTGIAAAVDILFVSTASSAKLFLIEKLGELELDLFDLFGELLLLYEYCKLF